MARSNRGRWGPGGTGGDIGLMGRVTLTARDRLRRSIRPAPDTSKCSAGSERIDDGKPTGGENPDVRRRFRRSALVDIDPGLLRVWIHEGLMELAPNEVYFSIGETV